MKKTFLSACALVLLTATGSMAQTSSQDVVITRLQGAGFEEIRVSQTWLGRVRIVAFNEDGVREIVLNPVTGEILRDWFRLYEEDEDWRDDDDDDHDDGDNDDDDDDDDDEDDDDEDDDDNDDDDDDDGDDD